MRWPGFRRVRRQVCRRIRDRMAELGVPGVEAYREHLATDPEEWGRLAILCRVTISRFFRDRGVFEFLGGQVLPGLARGRGTVRAWSAGCASGEEPYSLVILWRQEPQARFPKTRLEVLATDVDPAVLRRARQGLYPAGALRDLEPQEVEKAFEPVGEEYRLRDELQGTVSFQEQDLRREAPEGAFHLILCRNLAFTYFAEEEQRRILSVLLQHLEVGGALVLGSHERIPDGPWPLEPWSASEPVFRRL